MFIHRTPPHPIAFLIRKEAILRCGLFIQQVLTAH